MKEQEAVRPPVKSCKNLGARLDRKEMPALGARRENKGISNSKGRKATEKCPAARECLSSWRLLCTGTIIKMLSGFIPVFFYRCLVRKLAV